MKSRLFLGKQEFDWTLSIEPWGESFDIKAGQFVLIEARYNSSDGDHDWEVDWPLKSDDRVMTIGVMHDKYLVTIDS